MQHLCKCSAFTFRHSMNLYTQAFFCTLSIYLHHMNNDKTSKMNQKLKKKLKKMVEHVRT